MAEIVCSSAYGSDVFIQEGNKILLLTDSVEKGCVLTIRTLRHYSDLDVRMGRLSKSDGSSVGFVFKITDSSYINFKTGVLIYSDSWRSSPTRASLTNEDIKQVMPSSSDLYAFHSPGRFLILTTPNLSPKLHNFLTMI